MKFLKLFEEYNKYKPNEVYHLSQFISNNFHRENGDKMYKDWNKFGINNYDICLRFQKDGYIIPNQDKEFYYTITDSGLKLLKDTFLRKTLKDTLENAYQFNIYTEKETINDKIRYLSLEVPDIFLLFNQKIKENISKIGDRYTDWFNSQRQKEAEKLAKSRNIKEYNLINAFKYFFPNKIPSNLILYRGIKNEYKPEDYDWQQYSSWTLDYEQAVRFSKYHFTKFSWQKPNESKIQHILKTEINIDDIVVFIGGDESEVLLKNPVQNVEIVK